MNIIKRDSAGVYTMEVTQEELDMIKMGLVERYVHMECINIQNIQDSMHKYSSLHEEILKQEYRARWGNVEKAVIG